MADVQNDYNTTEGDPTVRIGNWVEQCALLSSTGHTRGALIHSATGQLIPPNTHSRTVQHLPVHSPDWLSSTQLDWREGLEGRTRVAPPLPSRAQQRDEEVQRRAIELIREEDKQKKVEEHKEQMTAMYGHRPPVNRRRVLGDSKGGGLDEAAITLHATVKGGMRPEVAGVREGQVSGLHGKNTAFSTPIELSKGGAHHQYQI